MKTVFVTGANGLLGTNLVLLLIKQGFRVKAFVRNQERFIPFRHKNLVLVEGALSDKKLLQQEIRSCDYVVHIAAITRQDLRRLDDYREVNVQGTGNILEACLAAKPEKLVYVGTANTFGYGTKTHPGDKEQSMKYPFTKSLYALSKAEAQKMVDRAAKKINITTLSPTFMLGAYDTKPSSGQLILNGLNKKIIFYPSGGKNFIHVKDVAQAVILAFTRKTSGEVFILANENLSYKDFFSKLVRVNHQKSILIRIPDGLLMATGALGEVLRRFGVKTALSITNAKILTVKNYYSNTEARSVFRTNFTPVEESISDAVNWFNNP